METRKALFLDLDPLRFSSHWSGRLFFGGDSSDHGKVNWQAIRWKLASPEAKVRFRREQLERSDTLKNRYRLADELLAMGRAHEACEVLEEGKKGVFAEDPELLLKIAEAKLDGVKPWKLRSSSQT